MKEISATEASRNFSRVLDGVEHHGERYAIVRHGQVVARLEPAARRSGAGVKALLGRQRPDASWTAEIAATRALLITEDRT